MSLFERFKLFVWIWKEAGKMNKLTELLGKLDGYKSLAGLLGIAAYYGLKAYGQPVPDLVLSTSYGFLSVGLVHKLEKYTGFVSKALDVLKSVLDALNKKKDEEQGESK